MAGPRRHRGPVALLFIAATATIAVLGGCDSTIVNTDDARPTMATSTTARATLSSPTGNDSLANAFDYAAPGPDGETAYYFTSPSKRWVCAIIPRTSAGCQSATGSTIPVEGAPDTVPSQDGTDTAPNAIELDRDGDPRFAALESPGFSQVPGPALVLPFGKVLSAAGFRCNVQEATGVSCASEFTGKGFTFSADGFTNQYTDLPT